MLLDDLVELVQRHLASMPKHDMSRLHKYAIPSTCTFILLSASPPIRLAVRVIELPKLTACGAFERSNTEYLGPWLVGDTVKFHFNCGPSQVRVPEAALDPLQPRKGTS